MLARTREPAAADSAAAAARSGWGGLRVRRVLSVVVTLGMVSALFLLFDVRAALADLLDVRPVWALAVCVAAAGSRVLRGFKWNVLLRAGGVRISNLEAVRLTFVGQFFAVWTPGAVGSDVYRTLALRDQGAMPVVVSSLLLERYASLLAVTAMAAATLPWTLGYWLDAQAALALPLVVAMVLVVAALPFAFATPRDRSAKGESRHSIVRKIRRVVDRVRESLASFGRRPGVLGWFFALSVIEVLSYVLIPYVSLLALGTPVAFSYLVCAMPLVYLILKIPLSIQDLGIQEGALVAALAPAGVAAPVAIAVSLLQRAAQWASGILPGALLWMWTPNRSNSTER